MSKTVTLSEVRINGNRESHQPSHSYTPEEALLRIIEWELGCGGRIIKLTPTELVVRTQVIETVDVITVTGDEESMVPVVSVMLQWRKHVNKMEEGVVDKIIQDAFENSSGEPVEMRPLYVQHFMPILVGANMVREFMVNILASVIGVDAERARKNRVVDLQAAAGFIMRGECTQSDAQSLLEF